MPVPFQCPKCSQTLQAELSWSGQQTQCPYCKNVITIPDLTTIPQVGSQVINASANNPNSSDYLLLRMFDGVISSLRSFSIFKSAGKWSTILAKLGATSYILLGLLLFIACCINAKHSDSTWLSILNGGVLFIGCVIFSYVGLYMFKQFSIAIKNSENDTVPVSIINTITLIFAGACLYYLVLGITNAVNDNDRVLRMYKDFREIFICLPVVFVGLTPSIINANAGEGALFQNVKGIFMYFGKSVLIAAPYVWAYDAIFRVVHLLIHLGAERKTFTDALDFTRKDLPTFLVWPMFIYIGFLLLSLIFKIIERKLECRQSE